MSNHVPRGVGPVFNLTRCTTSGLARATFHQAAALCDPLLVHWVSGSPSTAARFKVRNRSDIRDNVHGGLAYLRWLLAYYQGEVTLAVAAYNAGEAAVDKFKGVPPYAETRDYVRRVARLFPNQRHSFDPSVAAPSPMLVSAERTPGPKAP